MSSKQKTQAEIRQKKLEDAMRANLLRRKTQAKARTGQNSENNDLKHPDREKTKG